MDQETFDHVWLCTDNNNLVLLIMKNFRSSLVDLLKKHSANIDSTYLLHFTLWNICYDTSTFTFIDIIKEIVPGFLMDKRLHMIKRLFVTFSILSMVNYMSI